MKKARIATYREGTVQCIRGPIAEAKEMAAAVMAGNKAAVLRVENYNHSKDDAYIEVALPFTPKEAT